MRIRNLFVFMMLGLLMLCGVVGTAKADWPPPPGTKISGFYSNGKIGKVPVDLTVLEPDAAGNIRIQSSRGSVSLFAPDGAQLENPPYEKFPGGRAYIKKGQLTSGSTWTQTYTQERLNPDTNNWGRQLRSNTCKVGNQVMHAGREAIEVVCADKNLQEPSWRPIDIAMVVDLKSGYFWKISRRNGQNWSPWGDDEMEITSIQVPPGSPAPARPPAIVAR